MTQTRAVSFDRGLSPEFLKALQPGGPFACLVDASRAHSLDLQIRKDYLNLYHQGCSVLKLSRRATRFEATIDSKYLEAVELPDARRRAARQQVFKASDEFIKAFLGGVQAIKETAEPYASKEAGVEEEIIRAHLKRSCPVVFIDRQVEKSGVGKSVDLVGLTSREQFLLAELKCEADDSIQRVHKQIAGYCAFVAERDGLLCGQMAHSYRKVVSQKQILGLLSEKTKFPSGRPPVICLLILYNYKKRSRLLGILREAVREAPLPLPLYLVQLPEGNYQLPPQEMWEELSEPHSWH